MASLPPNETKCTWNGAIEIVECSADGTRIYFEEGIRQSQATPDGESVFSYVKLMDELKLPKPALIDVAVPANQNLGLPHGV